MQHKTSYHKGAKKQNRITLVSFSFSDVVLERPYYIQII